MISFFIKVETQYKKWELLLLYFAGLTTFTLMILITLDIILRNIFNSTLYGVVEIVGLLLVATIVCGFSFIQGMKGNIIVEIATAKLPVFYRRILDIFGCIIGLFLSGIITWLNILYVISSYLDKETTMGVVSIPVWPAKFILALSMFSLTLRLFLDVILLMANIKKPASEGGIKC